MIVDNDEFEADDENNDDHDHNDNDNCYLSAVFCSIGRPTTYLRTDWRFREI